MEQQLFSFDLNSKVAIYVPSTMNVNEECDNTEYVKNTIKQLSTWFGGATARTRSRHHCPMREYQARDGTRSSNIRD